MASAPRSAGSASLAARSSARLWLPQPRRVPEVRRAHSLHGYFIRPGDPETPIIYEVDRYRDGRSFTTRQVVAIQHGVPIFTMAASFHIAEAGFEHQIAMPVVPMPEELPAEREILERHSDKMPENMRRYFSRQRPIELRPVEPLYYLEPRAGGPAAKCLDQGNRPSP